MKKQTFIFSSAVLIISAVITKLIGALFRIPLANILGGTGMGYFSGAYGIFMTVYAISVTGLPAAVARLVAENSILGRYANIRKIKYSAVVFFGITGLVFTIILIAASYPLCMLSKETNTLLSVIMIAPSIFFCCITSVYRGYYEGLRNMFPTAISQVMEGIFKLFSGLALCSYVIHNPTEFDQICVLFGNCSIVSVASAAAVFGISISSAAGTLFLIVRDKIWGDGISDTQITSSNFSDNTDSSHTIITQLLKNVVPIAACALVTNLTSLIDVMTVTRSLEKAIDINPHYFSEFTDATPLSELPNFLYGSFTGLAVTIFNLIPSLTNMIGKGILPSLSESFAAKYTNAIIRNTEKALITTALISIPAGFGITALSECILNFLFSSKPVEAKLCITSMSILGVAVAFLCISSTIFSVFQAAGKADLPVKIMISGIIVKLIGNLLLVPIPKYNIAGAAVSTLMCYLVICILSILYMIKLTQIDKKNFAVTICKICYSSVMCATSAKLTEEILSNALNPSFVLFISILVGVIFYILFTYLLGIFTKSTLKLLIS